MRATTLLLAGLLLTTGCLGSQDDDGASAPILDGDGQAAQTEWQTDTSEGEATGATAPGGGSVTAGGGNTASFTVPDGTRIMYLNVTTDGGDVEMHYGPDCQTDPTIACENMETTSDGELSVTIQAPQSGSWEAYFFVSEDTAAGQVAWTLEVTTGVVTPTG